jgi:hypothetical protein
LSFAAAGWVELTRFLPGRAGIKEAFGIGAIAPPHRPGKARSAGEHSQCEPANCQ